MNNIHKAVDGISDTPDTCIKGRKENQVCEKPEEDDHFPGDNLEQELVAKRLFGLADFYPKPNVVEAYLRSRNGHGNKNSIETLRLWNKILELVQNQRELLELSPEEINKIDASTEKINTLIEEVSVGLDCPRSIEVELPEKINKIIPEIIAKLEERIVLMFTSEGCHVATGFGSQAHSRRVVPIYKSTSIGKMYQFFGMKFFTEKVKIPIRIVNEMTYRETNRSTVHVNAWGKEKIVGFLENFDPTIPVDERIDIFLKKLEDEKEYERAAEWMKQLPQAMKRNLYNLRCGDVLLRSAYRGSNKQGL